ncbi:MAG TPA: SgcJ/EcaC family oxidoreductase [Bryobacteraceae bacterium]|jgi:uncharacterized protein (TIGR02246 family)|nr:SgcJ/EcaC family oxidoreductase [Bryobacteraceae bacterium]
MSADEQAIREVIATWGKASADGDLPLLLSLMSDDIVFLTPGKPPMMLKDFVGAITKMRGTHRFNSLQDIEEIKVGGDLACCRSHLTVTIVPLEESAPVAVRSGYVLSVFHKQANGKWVLFRDANLMV